MASPAKGTEDADTLKSRYSSKISKFVSWVDQAGPGESGKVHSGITQSSVLTGGKRGWEPGNGAYLAWSLSEMCWGAG